MQTRQFYVLISDSLPEHLPLHTLIVGGQGIPFSKATNLLGQEFEHILFDARKGMHLEVLAIVVGTLKRGGTCCLVLAHWDDLANHIDEDSLRWNGHQHAIATPNFIRHFKQCLARYDFPIFTDKSAVIFPDVFCSKQEKIEATAEQTVLLEQIRQATQDCYFLTAKRGRGKSALLGMLANRLNAPIYLTAPNKSAVKTLQDFAENQPYFIAPDELSLRLQQDASFSDQAWLFVDEAAMIPLPLLQQFSQHFQHIIFSTTIHSYEGTGRGFELKFKQKINRTFLHLELQQPLRWQENDPLECFIEDLLLLNAEDEFRYCAYRDEVALNVGACCTRPEISSKNQQGRVQHAPTTDIRDFYGLMILAHYRTSPIDLRRLLDGEGQRFYLAKYEDHLLGAIWALEEGNMQDDALIEQIQQGKRRPKGNLVPQALCFHANLPQACHLRSLRISRIAVQPNWQHHGVGQRLIKEMNQANVDFLSVSFGYTEELAQFWQKCGFILVQLGEHQEASSGCYSVIALKGLSEKGHDLTDIASEQFQRDLPLSTHPLLDNFSLSAVDWALNAQDWKSLKNFANFHRTLFSALPAIRRLLKNYGEEHFPSLSAYLTKKQLPFNKKKGVEYLRLEIKQFLQKEQLKELL